MASTTVPSSGRRRSALLSLATAAALVAGTVVTGTVATATAAPAPAAAASAVPVAPAAAAAPAARGVTTGVSGRVVDALSGRGVPYALVTVGSTPVRSDASGAFTAPAGAGAAAVRASARGYRPAQRSQPVRVGADAVSGGVVLRLVPLGRLAGTVTDDRGSGRIGVAVAVIDRAGSVVGTATTDLRGRWTVAGLPAGSYRVRYSGAATGVMDGWQGGGRATSVTVTDASRQVLRTSLARTSTLRGTARDRFGRVSPGAVVTVADRTGRRTVSADAAGRWEIGGVAPGRGSVAVTTAARRPLAFAARTLAGGTTTTVTTTAVGAARPRGAAARSAAATGVLVVRFTDPAGRPVSGLDVMAGCDFEAELVVGSTDTAGRVRLRLPRGQLCGYVAQDPRERFLAVYGRPFVIEAATLDLGTVVLQRPVAVSGRVTTTTGRSVTAAVVVTLQDDGDAFGEGAVAVTRTAADGSFSATGLVPGRYSVEVVPDDESLVRGYWRRSGTTTPTTGSADLVVAAPGSAPERVLIGVSPAGAVTGRAVDRDGRPVAGLTVVPARGGLIDDTRWGSGSWTAVPPVIATTGADGSYELPQLAPGSYQLVFESSDSAQLQTGTAVVPGVAVTAGTRRSAPDAVVTPSGALTGRLTGSTGRPVAGGLVAAHCESDPDFSGDVEDLFPAYTDEDGSYWIDGVTGSCVVGVAPDLDSPLVWLPDRSSPLDAAPVTVPAGRVTHLDVRIPRVVTGSVTGTVTGAAHTAGLTVVLLDPTSGATEATTATDASGRYRFDRVLPGRHLVAVLGLDAATTFAPSAVRRDDAGAVTVDASRTTVADVTVGRAGAFSGTVRATAGGTVRPQLSVLDAVTGEDVDFRLSGTAPFTVTGLSPGRYRVRAATREDARWNDDAEQFVDAPALEIAAGRTLTGVDITLDTRPDADLPTRLVSGTLQLPDGDPVLGWPTVSVIDDAGLPVAQAEVSDAGRFIVRLAPGSYRAVWSGSDTVPGVITRFTVSASGLQRDVVLRPGPAGQVLVRLRSDDPSGALGDVVALVVDSRGMQQQGFVQDGTITVTGLNRGPAHVYVFAANRTASGIPVTVGASTASVTVTVTAAASLSPQLISALPDVEARVDLLDDRGGLVDSGYAGSYGAWSFSLLPRQRLRLRVSGPGLETRFWSVDGIGGPPSVLTLQPGRARRDIVLPVVRRTTGVQVSGTVTLDGDPMPVTQVSLWDPGSGLEVGTGLTAADGGFTLPLVPPGRYRLGAVLCLADRYQGVSCEFPAVSTDVTVAGTDVTGVALDLRPLQAAGTGSAQVGGAVRAGGSARLTLRDLPEQASADARWLLDGVPVEYVSGDLEPPAEWVGHRLSAVVVVSQQGHRSYRLHSDAVVVAPGQLRAPVPTISGRTVVGSRLTAVTGSWTPATTALAVRWLRDGRPIAGATARTHVLTAADRGHRISVTVTGSATGYVTASRTSAATTAVR